VDLAVRGHLTIEERDDRKLLGLIGGHRRCRRATMF